MLAHSRWSFNDSLAPDASRENRGLVDRPKAMRGPLPCGERTHPNAGPGLPARLRLSQSVAGRNTVVTPAMASTVVSIPT